MHEARFPSTSHVLKTQVGGRARENGYGTSSADNSQRKHFLFGWACLQASRSSLATVVAHMGRHHLLPLLDEESLRVEAPHNARSEEVLFP